MTSVHDIPAIRRALVEGAAERTFDHGRLRIASRDPGHFFGVILPELNFALLQAVESAPGHPRADAWREDALVTLEGVAGRFTDDGRIGTINDLNSISFGLVPFTEALIRLRDRTPEKRWTALLEASVRLFDAAAVHINQTTDYLNPRGMDALAAMNLFKLTGETRFRDKASFWMDELIIRQYPCGAQPYHTGGWIWGRKPAQGYQLLTATMMMAVGLRHGRQDAIDYVRRLMDYELLTCTRRTDLFVTVFEGLHKAHSGLGAGLWPLATALGDKRFLPLAASSFAAWQAQVAPVPPASAPGIAFLSRSVDAVLLGVERVASCEDPFRPPAGVHACPDISAVFVHEPDRDVAFSLLSGYSALAEADTGQVKLFALTPELTDTPCYWNAGLDAVRVDWRVPYEQQACRVEGARGILRGRGFTKWINAGRGDAARFLHTRELEIGMEYDDGTLVLDYRTLRNRITESIPSRLLFLLIALPRDGQPLLRVGSEMWHPPAASSGDVWYREAPVGPVTFLAPDGSGLEIIPEVCRATRITAERPPHVMVPDADRLQLKREIKYANEGSLRLAFDGPAVLDEGRYRIRFLPRR
jgi:hypothetical protein